MSASARGTRRVLTNTCALCGAPIGQSCVKGNVSPSYGSSKQKRKPHIVYPETQPSPTNEGTS